jgi:hypothetical protein
LIVFRKKPSEMEDKLKKAALPKTGGRNIQEIIFIDCNTKRGLYWPV